MPKKSLNIRVFISSVTVCNKLKWPLGITTNVLIDFPTPNIIFFRRKEKTKHIKIVTCIILKITFEFHLQN